MLSFVGRGTGWRQLCGLVNCCARLIWLCQWSANLSGIRCRQKNPALQPAVAYPNCCCCYCPPRQELLHASRVVLPHLVRLLPAAAAAAANAADTLEFITQHTHHPHYPPFSSASAAAAGKGPGWGSKGDSSSLLEAGGGGAAAAGDQAFLLEVPRVLAQLMGERCAR